MTNHIGRCITGSAVNLCSKSNNFVDSNWIAAEDTWRYADKKTHAYVTFAAGSMLVFLPMACTIIHQLQTPDWLSPTP